MFLRPYIFIFLVLLSCKISAQTQHIPSEQSFRQMVLNIELPIEPQLQDQP